MTSTASEPLRVVYLTNFISPDIREICSELDRRLDELTVLVSVPMESNRHWKPADHEFRVQVQKTWTWTRTDRHPSGYEDVNYVHIPRDTYGQLRRRRPHVVISTELGARSMIASVYCRLHRNCRHVIAANTSQHIESSRRGRMRDLQRKLLLGRADWVTHNGPSCRMFLSE
ncbi:MAG: glycosyltransferase family 1 protein, partial [Planctomycetota bacterium]